MTTVYAVPVQTDQPAAATSVPVAAGVPVAGVKTEWVAVEESSRSIGGAKRIGRYRRPDRVMLISMPAQPPYAPPGGVWVEAEYFGPASCCMCCLGVLIFFPLALFPLLFPLDRELVYLAPDGSFWDADGEQVY